MGTLAIQRELLIEALRLRYDYYSAPAMLELACTRAGLPELPAYDLVQVRALRTALLAIGDRLTSVEAQLDALVAHAAPGAAHEAPRSTPAAPVHAPVAELTAEPGPASEVDEAEDGTAAAAQPAATPADSPAAMGPVTLALAGGPLEPGAQVLLCGGPPALGEWNAEHAVAMTLEEDLWRVAIKLPLDVAFDFKFLVRRSGGDLLWERGDNRTAVAAPRIDCTWR